MRVRVLRKLGIIAAVFFSTAAWAQHVVILEFDGDRAGKLRAQVEAAVKRTGVRLVPIKKYKDLAASRKLKGRPAMSPVAVARLAPTLKFDVAIEGAVGDSFFVRILDTGGQEVWSKELPITRGKQLSASNARRLAAAIKVAATTPPKEVAPPKAQPPPSPPSAPPATPPAVEAPPSAPPVAETKPAEKPAVKEKPAPVEKPRAEKRPPEKLRAERPARPRPLPEVEPEEGRRPKTAGPPLLKARLAGTTTWRSYCARPGVKSCGAYNSLPDVQRPAGDIADFSPQVPYLGFDVSAEAFPLMPYTDSLLRGLGLGGSVQMGFSSTSVRVVTPTGNLPDRKVVGVDLPWSVMAIYRYYFSREADPESLVGFLGVNVGYGGHNFDLDTKSPTRLPGSHRKYPFAGIEASYPFFRWLSADAAAHYLIDAKAGPDEIAGYGASASAGFAWQAEAGVSGRLWGPFGYSVRARVTSFSDSFTGRGTLWSDGGTAQETYVSAIWGLTAQFSQF